MPVLITRQRLIKVFMLGLLASVVGTTTSVARSEGEPAVLELTAKLVEIPSKYPPDDLYDYAYVMRYEVIGGALDKSSILVAHYKPRQPRSKIEGKMKQFVAGKVRSFNQGDVHKLKLSSDLKKIWKGPLVDEFAATDKKSTRYWCLVADPA
jgi:hypothetical protein